MSTQSQTSKQDISNSELLEHLQRYASNLESQLLDIGHAVASNKSSIEDNSQKIEENSEKIDKLTTVMDAVVKYIEDVRAEFAANRAAHERIDTRITRLEKHTGLV